MKAKYLKIIGVLILFLTVFFAYAKRGTGQVESTRIGNSNGLQTVELAQYGSLEKDSIAKTLQRAFDDVSGKKLVIPAMHIVFDKLDVLGKSKFEIEFLPGGEVNCESFRIIDCAYFSLHGLNLKGTREKFAIFDVIGNCYGFSIHDCSFDSEKDGKGENTFYGIHVRSNWNMANRKYDNSPRSFKIYNNHIKNTKFDGILVHANCSAFEIENNVIDSAKCIGIEVEGRYGGLKNTSVQPCKNVIIRNNKINHCISGWGMLLMWADSVVVENNISKDAYGSFLTIGSSRVNVRNNLFEGNVFGFEVSQEFYKIDNGINSDIVVEDNDIVAKPRANGRGALDIRHAKNINIRNNRIRCLSNINSACISVASSQNIKIEKNKFSCNAGIDKRVIINEVNDPETGEAHSELIVKDVDIRNNSFDGVRKVNSIMIKNLNGRNCHVD